MPMPLVGIGISRFCVGKRKLTLKAHSAIMLAKCARIPSGQERSMLERMIELIREEISLRRDRLHVMN